MIEFNRGLTAEQAQENRNNIMKVIASRILSILDIQELDYDQMLDSVGFNSIAMIELIIELEDQFNLILEDKELLPENFKTVALIAKLIDQKLSFEA